MPLLIFQCCGWISSFINVFLSCRSARCLGTNPCLGIFPDCPVACASQLTWCVYSFIFLYPYGIARARSTSAAGMLRQGPVAFPAPTCQTRSKYEIVFQMKFVIDWRVSARKAGVNYGTGKMRLGYKRRSLR